MKRQKDPNRNKQPTIGKKIDRLDTKIDQVKTSLEVKISGLDTKFGQLDTKFNQLNIKLDDTKTYLEDKIHLENATTYGLLKAEIDQLADKISNLPPKNELYGKLDAIMSELKTVREEKIVHSSWKDQIEDHEVRIVSLESNVLSQK